MYVTRVCIRVRGSYLVQFMAQLAGKCGNAQLARTWLPSTSPVPRAELPLTVGSNIAMQRTVCGRALYAEQTAQLRRSSYRLQTALQRLESLRACPSRLCPAVAWLKTGGGFTRCIKATGAAPTCSASPRAVLASFETTAEEPACSQGLRGLSPCQQARAGLPEH